MVSSLNTCSTHLGWAFWKSPGPFILGLFSIWYLEGHMLDVGLVMFSPFLWQLVPLGFWGFWNPEALCTAVKKDLKAGALSKGWSRWADVPITRTFLYCLQGQIPLLGRAPVLPFIRASGAGCAALWVWSVKLHISCVSCLLQAFSEVDLFWCCHFVGVYVESVQMSSCAYNCTTSDIH